MTPVDFVFATHNHQPVGNFDHVIEDAYQRAYAPFLAVMERHPAMRWALHQPGLLWEWIEAHHPDYLERVQALVRRGQVELLSGGFYEPILPAIPPADRSGQIARSNAWLERRFDVRPRGAWLAERVWEPQLAETLAEAGIEYTVLDDSHFKGAGIPARMLDGYWVTEENGRTLSVFPISQPLRYAIPFRDPEETIAILRAAATAPGRAAAPVLVLADDGEKFGVWSNTHALCYDEGWLDRFCTALAAESDWLRVRTFAEVLDRTQPRGRTYLPTASYAEMMEWALPPAAQRGLHRALDRVAGHGDAAVNDGAGDGPAADEDLRLYVRGGFWRNFLAKYPESNWLHKRMLDTSRRVAAVAVRRGDEHVAVRHAREALWKSQCNCAYWHGLFGGLYLPHLRGALYEQLLVAESALATVEPFAAFEVLDLDADRQPEIALRNDDLQAFVKPDEGGAVFELDARRQHFNILDVMTRREEAYHDRLRQFAAETAGERGGGTVLNLHDMVAVKEPGLEQRLFYDVYRRGSFIDHALAADATIERFVDATLPELAELSAAPYPWTRQGDGVRLERTTPLLVAGTPRLHVRKHLHLSGAALVADYELTQDGADAAEFVFAVELAVNFRAADAPDRWFEVAGQSLDDRRLGSTGVTHGVRRFDAVDAWLGLRVVCTSSVPAEVWRMAIETVSMSDGGFERVYQGSALLFRFPLRLAPGVPWSLRIGQGVDGA